MSKNTIAEKSTWTTDPKGSWPGITATVLSVNTIKGETYVTYHRTQKVYGKVTSEVKTLKEKSFRYFFKKDDNDFFAVGGTYKYTWGSSTYHVLETYTVSKPAWENARRTARVIAISPDDRRSMKMLDLDDFADMRRVK